MLTDATLAQESSTLPRSQLGKALAYLENQRESLEVFLNDPRVPLSNNDCERDLRHVVVGRANWLVFASPRGGEVACRLYSLVLSCKENGVDASGHSYPLNRYVKDWNLGSLRYEMSTAIPAMVLRSFGARTAAASGSLVATTRSPK